jgi:hypothetical protein
VVPGKFEVGYFVWNPAFHFLSTLGHEPEACTS